MLDSRFCILDSEFWLLYPVFHILDSRFWILYSIFFFHTFLSAKPLVIIEANVL
jgi:hypothetical protein